MLRFSAGLDYFSLGCTLLLFYLCRGLGCLLWLCLGHELLELIIEFLLSSLLKYFGVASMLGLELHELLVENFLRLFFVLG